MRAIAIVTSAAIAIGGAALTVPAVAQPASPATGNVCLDTNVAQALTGTSPGDLLADPQDVTADSGLATGSLFRILYATTGEAGSVVASCGLIAVPAGTAIKGVVAWAHGTVGLKANCQPSNAPDKFVGAMPSGIGAVTKGGNQADGALYGMLADGYAVVATDYPSAGIGDTNLQRYVLGVTEGMAVIDSARTLTRNAAKFGLGPIGAKASLPLVTWGHSQGGGSSIWAGQLAQRYLAARGDQTLNLAGVAAEAPATQFTTSPGQPASYMGNHLGDRDMYNFAPGLGVPFPIGVALFSYVTASWSQVRNATSGSFPVGPTDRISYQDVLTSDGEATAPTIAGLCLNVSGGSAIYAAALPYLMPNKYRFFDSPFGGSQVNGTWVGAIDATCANPGRFPPAIQDWCAWLQFNMPGPYGVNPYPKLPRANDGTKVPVYIAQGRNDRIIWCVDDKGTVQGSHCLTDQFFHSMKDAYCDGSGHLQVDYFPDVTHLGVPNSAATNPVTGTYTGSPLDLFISGAMKGKLPAMCSADPDATT
ncbi:MAG: lipase family protein [Candidatus Nanopelagicales bacterium]